jgi:1-aminocyclopropane-1-carboxylate deaminase
MPGAMTIAGDILENELKEKIFFDHIFTDSGSGASAAGLLLGLAHVKQFRQVHITLIAGTEEEFLGRYQGLREGTEKMTGIKIAHDFPGALHFHLPVISPSFGSITAAVLNEVKNTARTEGILMDPVYSIKHWMTARHIVDAQNLSGNILFICNGGSLGLCGFQQKLANVINH